MSLLPAPRSTFFPSESEFPRSGTGCHLDLCHLLACACPDRRSLPSSVHSTHPEDPRPQLAIVPASEELCFQVSFDSRRSSACEQVKEEPGLLHPWSARSYTLIPTPTCSHPLIHAHIHSYLLTPAYTCSYTLTPTHTCSYTLTPTHTCSHPLTPTHTCSFPLIPTLTRSYTLLHAHTCSYPLIPAHIRSYTLIPAHTCSHPLCRASKQANSSSPVGCRGVLARG